MPTLLLLHEGATDAAALRAALSSTSYRVAAEVSDAATLGAEVGRVAPDVIIASTETPGVAMLDALRRLADTAPRPVVMFASDPRREVIRRTVEAAPPLTAAQRDKLALLLRGGESA